MTYIAFAIFLFALSYVSLGAKKLRQQLYYPVLLSLFSFSAFRFQVGCDWSGYYSQYEAAEYVAEDLILNLSEPIWWVIVLWVKQQDFIYPVLNVISSLVFFFGVHVLARKQPDPLAFLVLLFPVLIINMPMSGIRQGAAIGLVCIAFAAFTDRRPIRFALLILIAGGFHISALIFMMLAPLATGRYSKTRLIMAAAFALPGVIFLASGSSTGTVVSRYLGDEIDAFGAIFRVGAMALTAGYFAYFMRKKWEMNYPADYSLVVIGSIGMVLALILIPISSVIADRFAYYLIPIQAIIFARAPFIPFASRKWIHKALPYLALLIMLVGWTQTSSLFEQCYLPYQSWIFGMPAGDILKEGALE